MCPKPVLTPACAASIAPGELRQPWLRGPCGLQHLPAISTTSPLGTSAVPGFRNVETETRVGRQLCPNVPNRRWGGGGPGPEPLLWTQVLLRTSSRVTVTQLLGGPELSPGTPPDEAGRVSGLQCFRGACCLRLLYKHEHSAEPVFPFFLILLVLV